MASSCSSARRGGRVPSQRVARVIAARRSGAGESGRTVPANSSARQAIPQIRASTSRFHRVVPYVGDERVRIFGRCEVFGVDYVEVRAVPGACKVFDSASCGRAAGVVVVEAEDDRLDTELVQPLEGLWAGGRAAEGGAVLDAVGAELVDIDQAAPRSRSFESLLASITAQQVWHFSAFPIRIRLRRASRQGPAPTHRSSGHGEAFEQAPPGTPDRPAGNLAWLPVRRGTASSSRKTRNATSTSSRLWPATHHDQPEQVSKQPRLQSHHRLST